MTTESEHIATWNWAVEVAAKIAREMNQTDVAARIGEKMKPIPANYVKGKEND